MLHRIGLLALFLFLLFWLWLAASAQAQPADCVDRTGTSQPVVITAAAYEGAGLQEGDSLRALSADGSLCVGKAAIPGAGNFTITLWGASVLPGGDTLPGLQSGEGWGLIVQRVSTDGAIQRHAIQKHIANGVDTFDPAAPFALIDRLWWSAGYSPFDPEPEPEPEPPADTTDTEPEPEPEPPAPEPEPEPPAEPDTLRYTLMGERGRIPDWRENPLDQLPADVERWAIRQEGFVPGNVGFSWVDYRWTGADSAHVMGSGGTGYTTEIRGDTLRLFGPIGATLIQLWGTADSLAFVSAEARDRASVDLVEVLPAPIGREPYVPPVVPPVEPPVDPEPEPEPPTDPEPPVDHEPEPEPPIDPEPEPEPPTEPEPEPEPPVDPEPEPPVEPEPIDGDRDGNGVVDLDDIALWLQAILEELRLR